MIIDWKQILLYNKAKINQSLFYNAKKMKEVLAMGGAQSNFKKGAVEMLVLHILNSGGDCYGYEISQLIKEVSDGYLYVPEGSLYPALYKLIDKGYITDYKKQVGKRMIRVYYHIEPMGVERLNMLVKEYYATSTCISNILNTDFQNRDKGEAENE